MEERNQLMEHVRERTLAARISLYALCGEAGVSGNVATRWIKYRRNEAGGCVPSFPTIVKLEKRLDERGS